MNRKTLRSLAWILFAIVAMLCIVSMVNAADKGPQTDAYATAYYEAVHAGKPLIVHYGATWCEPCRRSDKLYGPALRARGAYLHLDVDRDKVLIERYALPQPPSIPAVIVWERDALRLHKPGHLLIGLPRIGVYLGK